MHHFSKALVSVDPGGHPHLRVPLNQVFGSSGYYTESLTLKPSGAPEHHHSVTASTYTCLVRYAFFTTHTKYQYLLLDAILVTTGPSPALLCFEKRERNADKRTQHAISALFHRSEHQSPLPLKGALG